MLHHLRHYWYLLVLLIVDIVFFSQTSPTRVSAQLLVAGYVLLIISVYGLLRAFGRLARLYSKGLEQQVRRSNKLITAVIAVLIGMQSVGQLTLRDVSALFLLVIIGSFYLAYVRQQPKSA